MQVVLNFIKVAVVLCLITITFNCAGIQSPSGGPPDTTPPKIINTYPAPRTLNYHDNKFSFSFDKYIDRRTLQESFFVSPSLGELEFNWDGKDVEISFTDSLRINTTYIVTIGTDVVDTRKNRMAESFSLPFSTGETIDSASIAGVVIDDKPTGVMIFAYQLDKRNPDTLNPSRVKPDYLTQTGKDGTFLLPYLAYGNYRLIAMRDEYKNLFYDVQTDQYGVCNDDINLIYQVPKFTGVQFRMTEDDTTAPFLSSARTIDDSHVLLRFSETMYPTDIDSVIIVDTLTNTQLKMRDFSFDVSSRLDAQLVTDQQEVGRIYRVTLFGFKDFHGNAMRVPTNRADFNGSSTSDTSRPTFEIKGFGNNAKNISIDDTIRFVFSEAIRIKSFESGFSLKDSSKKKIEGIFKWQDSREFFFFPTFLLALGMQYNISLIMDSLIDYSGNSYKDSTFTTRFQTVEEKMLSSISGIVSDEVKDAKGKIYLTAVNAAKKEIKPKVQIIDSVGHFKFDHLIEGKYILSGFLDADSSGVYNFGKPFPYQPAERFVIYPDTLKLRARWPLEGVSIRFK